MFIDIILIVVFGGAKSGSSCSGHIVTNYLAQLFYFVIGQVYAFFDKSHGEESRNLAINTKLFNTQAQTG